MAAGPKKWVSSSHFSKTVFCLFGTLILMSLDFKAASLISSMRADITFYVDS